MTPRVTVTIPTWNRADLLALTIQSVLEQTLTDFELFVLDDASTDHTTAVVKSFDDPRLHYERVDQRIGLYRNLSRCLSIGNAPYIAFCHHDDLFEPDHLQQLVSVLDQNRGVGLAHSAFKMIDERGRILKAKVDWFDGQSRIESGRTFVERSLARGTRIIMSAAVIRRTVIEGLEFDEEDGPGTDLGLWLRVGLRADIAFCSEPLTRWRIHAASVSGTSGMYDVAVGPDQTFKAISNLKSVKVRFLSGIAMPKAEARTLRRAIRKVARRDLLNSMTRQGFPDRRFPYTLALARQAVRIEPSLLWHGSTARVLIASFAGERARSLVRHVRSS